MGEKDEVRNDRKNKKYQPNHPPISEGGGIYGGTPSQKTCGDAFRTGGGHFRAGGAGYPSIIDLSPA